MRKRPTFEIRDYWPWLVGIGDMEKIISSLDVVFSIRLLPSFDLDNHASYGLLAKACAAS